MARLPIANTLKQAILNLPGPEAGLTEMLKFCEFYNPAREFHDHWGVDYADRVRELWGRSTKAFKKRHLIRATPDELLMCMAYDAVVAPYLNISQESTLAYLHYVLDELRHSLKLSPPAKDTD